MQTALSRRLVDYSLEDQKLLELKGQEEGTALQSAMSP